MMLVHSKLWVIKMILSLYDMPQYGPFLNTTFTVARKAVLAVMILVLLSVFWGCSKESPLVELQHKEAYQDWKIFTYKTVNILYPPNHLQRDNFDEISQGLLAASRRITEWLGTEPYTDSLYIVYYTGFGQGREMTGQRWPYASDGVIYLWQPCFTTLPLADILIKRWAQGDSQNPILKHGLRAALDFTGADYHQRTRDIIERGQFEPISELAQDPGFLSDSERVQSAEAASLVIYILVTYNATELKALYRSDESFDKALEENLGINTDLLERNWLAFINQRTKATEPKK